MVERAETAGESDRKNGPGRPSGMPRWVKWSGIVVGLLILLFVVLQLTGLGGQHGPGRHLPGGGAPPTHGTAPVTGGGHG
jgi:hypothetical protein